MGKVWGGALAVTGFVACPCHLPLTLPLILGVLAGTGVGSFIGANTGLIYGLATGYFIVAIGVAWFLLNRKRRSVQTEDATGQHVDAPSRGRTLSSS